MTRVNKFITSAACLACLTTITLAMSVAARMDNGNLPALPPLDPAELGPSPPPIPTFPMATLKHFPAPERPAAPLDDHPFSPGMLKNPSALRDAIARAKAKVAEREKAKAAESAEPVTVEVHDRENGCEFTLDGEDYDLSELRLTGGQPEYIAVDASKMTYKLNMCAKDPVSGSDCQRSNGMVCQYTSGSNPNLEGVVARWDADPAPVWSFIDESHHEAGVKLSVVNGDDCNFHGMKKTREAVFFFPCNHAVGKLGTITVQETSTCTYVFNIPTSLSCPGEAGMSAGWHFIWTVFLISFCYVVGGCLYNRFRHNAEGIAMFPNLDFWRSLPGLVRDGFAYSRLLLDARMNGGSSSGGDMPDDKADYGAF